MKKVLKWVGLGALLAAVGGGVSLAAYVWEWPLGAVGVGVLVVAGLACAAVGWVRSRRKSEPAGDEPAATEPELPVGAEAGTSDLAQRWRTFVRHLRQARTKGGTDPLTALPWYLTLGAPGSGKTRAVLGGGRVVAATEDGAEEGQFSWHMLDGAVVLDPPGRYTLSPDPGDDREWGEFLSLLKRARRPEPLSGILLTVPAPSLLSADTPDAGAPAARIRKRLDEAMDALGVVVPVYVLVTQCDLLGGMGRFFEHFPSAARDQAMGALNDDRDPEGGPGRFTARVFGDLYARLRELRLGILGDASPEAVHPDTVWFPEEFLALQAPLGTWLEGVFNPNPYREDPFLRGLFFCSSLRSGTPLSRFLPGLDLQAEQLPQVEGRQGMFLPEFFSKILGDDRALVAPTTKAVGRDRVSRRGVLAAWVVAWVIVAGLWSVSFVQNLGAVRRIAGDLPTNPFLGPDFGNNLEMVDRMRAAIAGAHLRDAGRRLPHLGLSQDARLVRQLEGIYGGRFRRGILDPVDKELDVALDRVAVGGDPASVARQVDFMSRRAGLLQDAMAEEEPMVPPAEGELPDFTRVLSRLSEDVGGEAAGKVAIDYAAYLAWETDRRVLQDALNAEQARIKAFLARRSIGFDWLGDWANLQTSLDEVRAGTYWGEDVAFGEAGVLRVERAYTPEGWEAIRAFTSEIAGSVEGEAAVQQALAGFHRAYRREYFGQWERFLERFDRGADTWTGRSRRVELAGKLAGPTSPYVRLLADLPRGLAPAVGLTRSDETLPAWVPLVYRYERLNDPEYQRELKGGDGVVGRWTSKGGQFLGDLKAKIRGEQDEAVAAKQDRAAYPHLMVYQETLKKAAAQAQSAKASYQISRETFLEAGASVGEPEKVVPRNFWAQSKLREVLSGGSPREETFWYLLRAPAAQVWSILLDEAQEHLQGVWQQEALAEGGALGGWDRVDALLGSSGSVWAFREGSLEPFLAKNDKGRLVARALYGDALSCTDAFLRMLRRGKLPQKALAAGHRVKVSALPTDANPGATVQPHRTTLVLQCNSGNQEVVNLNYPLQKTLVWSAGDCADTSLEIAVGDAVMTQRYPGHDGFIRFLEAFRGGSHLFRRDEFPEQKGLLAAYKVKNLTVRYKFQGNAAVLKIGNYSVASVPRKIFRP